MGNKSNNTNFDKETIEFLEKQEGPKIAAVLRKESPRAMAVLAGAYFDHLLNKLLKIRLVEDKKLFKDVIDKLTYERRIVLCYLTGVINIEIREILKIIGRVRNEFAHDIYLNSFEGENICNECNKLYELSERFSRKHSKGKHRIFNFEADTPQEKFLFSVSSMMGWLEAVYNVFELVKESGIDKLKDRFFISYVMKK